ncbi:MAG: choice-of-anchor J domain-containing protein [Xanthomonadales bacterium]|nr:choice-of-anchor J domain-containing protein [Xanthomonadales bacterium]
MKISMLSAVALTVLAGSWGTASFAQDNGSRTTIAVENLVPGKPEFNPRGPAILSEDFADITTLAGAGWVQTNNSVPVGTTGWFQGNDAVFPSQAGASTAYIGANFNNTAGTGTIDNWLITPVLPLATVGEMSFWTRSPDGSTFPDRIQVWMNVTNTGSVTSDFTVMIADINPTSTAGWAQTVINSFPGAPAQGRLAFRYFVTNGGPNGANSDYIGIDSLEILGGMPTLSLGMVSVADMCAAIPANNNGVIEPGETVDFTLPIDAAGGDFTNVVGTLTSATAGVTIVTGMGAYGNIANGGSASANYQIRLDETVACSSNIDLTLSVTSTEGNFSFPVTRPVGQSATFTYNGLPLAITDNTPAGVTSTADVAGVPSAITNVQVQINTTHTWVGDLIFTLQSPNGTTVTLLDQPGVPASTFGCNNNDVNVLFADGQPDPEAICTGATGDAWPVTNAGPVTPLSAFNGEMANGQWTLTVSDNAAGDTGTLMDWELIITPAAVGVCNVCPSNADLTLTKTAAAPSPLSVGDTITYTLMAANAGPGDATGVVVTDPLPANVTYVSNTCGATFAAGTLTWNIGGLLNGAGASCDVVVTVNAVGGITNTATVTGNEADPTPANNAGTSTLAGAFLADVVLLKSNNATGGLAPGDAFSFFINVTNNGPTDATNVVVTDVLSNKVSYVANTCGATVTGATLTWTIPTLANGAEANCEIQVIYVGLGDVINLVSSTANEPDPIPANNTDIESVATANAVPVPALNGFTLAALAALMAGLGLWMRRRFVKG